MKANRSTAVMQRRAEPTDSLDFFPTPPWATRAFVRDVMIAQWNVPQDALIWEPAAGEGHMAEVLRESFDRVRASDVHDYGCGYEVGSFVGVGPDVMTSQETDWFISNPPFNLAIEFVLRALAAARQGVCMLLRSSWVESEERYEFLFRRQPPTCIVQYCERVPMVKGRWDPDGSTATSYAWFCWRKGFGGNAGTQFVWLPPGRKARWTLPTDRARFVRADEAAGAGPLFAGALS